MTVPFLFAILNSYEIKESRLKEIRLLEKHKRVGRHIPWWEKRGNPILRKLYPEYCDWNFKENRGEYLWDLNPKEKIKPIIPGTYHTNRSFVLHVIQKVIIERLFPHISREEIHKLVDEAFDFDLESYKKQWYQANEGKRMGF